MDDFGTDTEGSHKAGGCCNYEVSIVDYIQVIMRYKYLIMFFVIIGIAFSCYKVYFTPQKFISKASILVSSARTTESTRIQSVIVHILESQYVLDEIIDQIDLNSFSKSKTGARRKLQAMVDAQAKVDRTGSSKVTVVVTDTEPARAALIANIAVRLAVEKSREYVDLQDREMEMLDFWKSQLSQLQDEYSALLYSNSSYLSNLKDKNIDEVFNEIDPGKLNDSTFLELTSSIRRVQNLIAYVSHEYIKAQAAVVAKGRQVDVSIFDKAVQPDLPVRQDFRKLIVIYLLAGLFSGLFFAVVLDFLQKVMRYNIKTKENINQMFTKK